MLRRFARILFLVAILTVWAGICLAQGPDGNASYATYVAYPTPLSCVLFPNGAGQTIMGCYTFGGVTATGTITATLNDSNGNPVPNWPASSIWLRTSQGGVAWCPYNWPPGTWPGYTSIADGPTSPAGQTRFTRAYFGGMQTNPAAGEGTEVWTVDAAGNNVKLNGTAPFGPLRSNLNISFNSPDINGDLSVDLSDVILFSNDFFGAYNYRSDFFWDGNLNLADIVWLAQAFGARCP
ncbi:MAG: hypothetical protein ABIF77_09990 [bacterium]